MPEKLVFNADSQFTRYFITNFVTKKFFENTIVKISNIRIVKIVYPFFIHFKKKVTICLT